MKKILFLFITALIVVSCDDTSKDIQLKTLNFTVNNTSWIENTDSAGLNRYYSCHIAIPEITSTVFSGGTVTSYIAFTNPNSLETLPYVRHYQNAAGALWTQTIDFDYSVGGVNIYVTNSDFVVDPPSTMSFRFVII
ncbi:MAG: hypothetical protein P4L34_02780 [Paludibacter sp.]|nr:hypothetical protein [Paludibacter sp.]